MPAPPDNRLLTDNEHGQVQRLFSDPLSIPLEFKQWLVRYLESSDMLLPRSSVHGIRAGGAAGGATEWEDVGTAGVLGRAAALRLQAAATWDKVIPNNSSTPIHWSLIDTPADFDDYWYLVDAIGDPTAGPEFVSLGMKQFGAVFVSGWVSCPVGPPSVDYKRVIEASIGGGLVFCTNEEFDYRVRNLGLSGVGSPFSVWDPPNELGVSFLQQSGAAMTLSGSGSYAWLSVVFLPAVA